MIDLFEQAKRIYKGVVGNPNDEPLAHIQYIHGVLVAIDKQARYEQKSKVEGIEWRI